eukprot:948562-Pleurochrysis_carterae.AAC.1
MPLPLEPRAETHGTPDGDDGVTDEDGRRADKGKAVEQPHRERALGRRLVDGEVDQVEQERPVR